MARFALYDQDRNRVGTLYFSVGSALAGLERLTRHTYTDADTWHAASECIARDGYWHAGHGYRLVEVV